VSKSLRYYLWLGLTLTALFFYPLVSSLSDGLYYMQWQIYNTYELLVCLLIGMAIFSSTIFLIEKISNKFVSSTGIMILSVIPISSFTIHLCRQLGFTSSLSQFSKMQFSGQSLLFITLVFCAIISVVMLFLFKELIGKIILSFILIISPVTVVIAMTIVQHGFKDTLIDIPDENLKDSSNSEKSLPNIYVLLFDELDYDFLYEDKKIKPEFLSFLEFSNVSINYHNATAPGDSTLPSMTGLFLGERGKTIVVCHDSLCEKKSKNEKEQLNFSEKNIFKIAKSLGYRTAMYGWMHEYCQQYTEYMDSCRTYGLYNYANIHNKFSFLNPILSNIILWPHQFPFGLLKVPVYSKYQQLMVDGTLSHTLNAIDNNKPLFMVAHFSVPHIPFVFDANGYNPPAHPFLQNRENYIKQLTYTDRVFGQVLDKIKNTEKNDGSITMVSSDHGYRILLKREDWNKVPLLIRHAKNEKTEDVDMAVMTENILFDLFDTDSRD
jgi:sulfatase-like protein